MNGHRVDDIDEALMVDGVCWKKGLAMYGPRVLPENGRRRFFSSRITTGCQDLP